MINHTLKLIKNIKTAHMDIKLFAVTMISTQNLFSYIEVKKLYPNLWKKCLTKLNIVRMLSNTNLTSH